MQKYNYNSIISTFSFTHSLGISVGHKLNIILSNFPQPGIPDIPGGPFNPRQVIAPIAILPVRKSLCLITKRTPISFILSNTSFGGKGAALP